MPVVDMIGKRFGRLAVVGQSESKLWRARWVCVCDCGREAVVDGANLRTGHVQSCGCLQRDSIAAVGKRTRKHGAAIDKTPEYAAWASMKTRCFNPKAQQYANYGARGITVCAAWRDSFEAFIADMGARPSSKHSLDRIDNERGYEPENCRWATVHQQNNNQRHNRLIEVDGVVSTVAEAIARLGAHPATIKTRINRGWSIDRAFSVPIKPKTSRGKRRIETENEGTP